MNRDPLTAPKQDSPTKTGISQDITPRWYSPKLWQSEQNAFSKGTERENGWFKADASETHHSDRLRRHHDFRGDGGEVGQVGQDVHHRHYGHGYDDRQRQVPAARGGSHMSRSWPNSNVAATSRSLLDPDASARLVPVQLRSRFDSQTSKEAVCFTTSRADQRATLLRQSNTSTIFLTITMTDYVCRLRVAPGEAPLASKHLFWFVKPLLWTAFVCIFAN